MRNYNTTKVYLQFCSKVKSTVNFYIYFMRAFERGRFRKVQYYWFKSIRRPPTHRIVKTIWSVWSASTGSSCSDGVQLMVIQPSISKKCKILIFESYSDNENQHDNQLISMLVLSISLSLKDSLKFQIKNLSCKLSASCWT